MIINVNSEQTGGLRLRHPCVARNCPTIFAGQEDLRSDTGLSLEKWLSLRCGLAPWGGCFHGTEEAYG